MLAHGAGMRKMFGTVSLDPTGRSPCGPTLSDHRDRARDDGPPADRGRRAGHPVRRVRGQIFSRSQDQRSRLHLHPGGPPGAAAELPVPPRPDLRRRRTEPARPLRGLRLAREEGGKPVLSEEYTYLNVKLNNGFTDADFDVRNPNYQFNRQVA